MEELYYNGLRLRNDAEELARRIGVDYLPQYYEFGVYAGWTRGEVGIWHRFADLIARTEAFLEAQGIAGLGPHFRVHPTQSISGSLKWMIGNERLEVEDDASLEALCADWDAWAQSFQEMRVRQPMLRLEELVSEYCANSEEGWGYQWFYGNGGQCKLLDWAERECADPLPFKEMKPVVTPAFRQELAAIRARRVGWLLDLGHQWEYHLVYCDEDEVAAFRRKHCGRPPP